MRRAAAIDVADPAVFDAWLRSNGAASLCNVTDEQLAPINNDAPGFVFALPGTSNAVNQTALDIAQDEEDIDAAARHEQILAALERDRIALAPSDAVGTPIAGRMPAPSPSLAYAPAPPSRQRTTPASGLALRRESRADEQTVPELIARAKVAYHDEKRKAARSKTRWPIAVSIARTIYAVTVDVAATGIVHMRERISTISVQQLVVYTFCAYKAFPYARPYIVKAMRVIAAQLTVLGATTTGRIVDNAKAVLTSLVATAILKLAPAPVARLLMHRQLAAATDEYAAELGARMARLSPIAESPVAAPVDGQISQAPEVD